METLVSGEWPMMNPDFDGGSMLNDFDYDDFAALTNPACSPNSESSNNPQDIMTGQYLI